MADDGQIVGLTELESDAEKISEILKTRMEPIPEFRLRFHKTEGDKVLLILDVFKGEETPYYYSGDGTLEAFVRIGNESVKASATELKRLVLRGRNTSYDSQVTPYRVEDYAFSKLRERYKKWTGNSFDNKDLGQHRIIPDLRLKHRSGGCGTASALPKCSIMSGCGTRIVLRGQKPLALCDRCPCFGSLHPPLAALTFAAQSIICAFGLAAAAPRSPYRHLELCGIALVSFGLADEGGFLTNAGALIADESPIRWSRLFCTRWNGLDKSGGTVDELDDAEYSGSVLSLIENGEAFIKRNARMMWRKTPNSREEMPEYVERSYHEALANALAHRDYLVYGNPVLADVFNRLGYMERKGSGFGKILNGYKAQINFVPSKAPMFRSDRYQFTVIMPNLNYGVPQDVPQGVPQDDLDSKILALIKKDNKVSTEKLSMALGISYKTIRRHIKAMGNVHYISRGFSGHWKVDEK